MSGLIYIRLVSSLYNIIYRLNTREITLIRFLIYGPPSSTIA